MTNKLVTILEKKKSQLLFNRMNNTVTRDADFYKKSLNIYKNFTPTEENRLTDDKICNILNWTRNKQSRLFDLKRVMAFMAMYFPMAHFGFNKNMLVQSGCPDICQRKLYKMIDDLSKLGVIQVVDAKYYFIKGETGKCRQYVCNSALIVHSLGNFFERFRTLYKKNHNWQSFAKYKSLEKETDANYDRDFINELKKKNLNPKDFRDEMLKKDCINNRELAKIGYKVSKTNNASYEKKVDLTNECRIVYKKTARRHKVGKNTYYIAKLDSHPEQVAFDVMNAITLGTYLDFNEKLKAYNVGLSDYNKKRITYNVIDGQLSCRAYSDYIKTKSESDPISTRPAWRKANKFKYDYDIKSCVPRVSYLLKTGIWKDSSFDFYDDIAKNSGINISRDECKSVFMRWKFSPSLEKSWHDYAFIMRKNPAMIPMEYKDYSKAYKYTEKLIGKDHTSEVFYWESYLELCVTLKLKEMGINSCNVYDNFYYDKSCNIESIIQDAANCVYNQYKGI